MAIYLLSPLDLIPDFLPVIGQMLAPSAFIRLAPDDVVHEYLPQGMALAA